MCRRGLPQADGGDVAPNNGGDNRVPAGLPPAGALRGLQRHRADGHGLRAGVPEEVPRAGGAGPARRHGRQRQPARTGARRGSACQLLRGVPQEHPHHLPAHHHRQAGGHPTGTIAFILAIIIIISIIQHYSDYYLALLLLFRIIQIIHDN